jgi:hypothetical protein
VELESLEFERADQLDAEHLQRLRRRLTELKTEALEKHAEGRLNGEEQMVSFLAHVTDVRSYLESLFAHESRQLGKAGVRCRSDWKARSRVGRNLPSDAPSTDSDIREGF